MRSFLNRLALAAAFVLAPIAAPAGSSNMAPIPPAHSAPPPSSPLAPTRVGCLSLLSGKVWFRAAGAANWLAAEPNFPVATGEAVRTDAQSRATIEIGPHTLDLAPQSEIDIDALNRKLIALSLPQGRLYLHLRRPAADEAVKLAVPGGGVQLSEPGEYDIAAGSQSQPARIAVFAGDARFSGGGADTAIAPGRTAVITAAKPPAARLEKAAPDDFDAWARAQDYRQAKLVSLAYVSPEMTGYAALDGHGRWHDSTRYGEVWYPDGLPANWAPFRYGHWRHIAPWGWTWIDDQPWGFAPSHYGRWALIGNRWGWVPGRPVDDPAYVPAVVAFLGTPGVGLSVANSATPAIGWFPLAPGEVYWPSYARDLDYVRRLNRGDVADPARIVFNPDGNPPVEIVTDRFADRLMASVVSRPDFVAGHPVAPALLQLPAERLANAPVITGSPRLGPAPTPRPEVAVARAKPAVEGAAKHRPERLAARYRSARRPIATRRVAERRVIPPGRSARLRRRVRAAHLRVPAYAGRTFRARRLVAYPPRRGVRRARR
jgi:hypothetical protein